MNIFMYICRYNGPAVWWAFSTAGVEFALSVSASDRKQVSASFFLIHRDLLVSSPRPPFDETVACCAVLVIASPAAFSLAHESTHSYPHTTRKSFRRKQNL